MGNKVYKEKPVLKTGEWSKEEGEGAYIYLDEEVNIPGLEKSYIRFEFDNKYSFDEVNVLTNKLMDMGFCFVVQPK